VVLALQRGKLVVQPSGRGGPDGRDRVGVERSALGGVGRGEPFGRVLETVGSERAFFGHAT